LRSKIVLACAEGADNKTVEAELRCAAMTVGKWRRRFIESHLDGLVDEDRPGRPASITLEQVEEVLVATLESTPKNATHWSRSSMAAESGLSASTIGRIWKDFGLQPHRSDGFKLSHDPLFPAQRARRELFKEFSRNPLTPITHTIVADLIDPDPAQTLQRVTPGDALGHHSRHDRPDRAPGDPQQHLQRRLARPGRHPRDGVLEHARVPRVVPSPRHRRHDHPVLGAGHPRRVGLQEHPVQAQIRAPPPPAPLALVIARAAPPAQPAAAPRAPARPHVHHHRFRLVVELDLVDHRALLDS